MRVLACDMRVWLSRAWTMTQTPDISCGKLQEAQFCTTHRTRRAALLVSMFKVEFAP